MRVGVARVQGDRLGEVPDRHAKIARLAERNASCEIDP
jgi:hypothetical protein